MFSNNVVLYLAIPTKERLLSFSITERTIGSVVCGLLEGCRIGLVIASCGTLLAQ